MWSVGCGNESGSAKGVGERALELEWQRCQLPTAHSQAAAPATATPHPAKA